MAHRKSPTLPPLRFEDGDVIVKLSADPTKWLLLHADVLRAASPSFFALSLQPKWGRTETFTLPGSQDRREVYTFAMVVKDGTFFLESDAEYSEVEQLEFCTELPGECFFTSEFNDVDLPVELAGTLAYERTVAEATSSDFQAMFAFVYQDITGQQATLDQILSRPSYSEWGSADLVWRDTGFISRVANILALADYHGLYDLVAPRLLETLLTSEDFCDATYCLRKDLMPLAKFFRSKELYRDILRRELGPVHANDREPIDAEWLEKVMEVDAVEVGHVIKIANPVREEQLENLTSSLKQMALAPVTFKASYDGAMHSTYTSLSNAMDHRPKRENRDIKALQIESLVLSIWGQYFIQVELPGDATSIIYRKATSGKSSDKCAPTFQEACENILDAATRDDPSTLFGVKVPEHYARIWTKGAVESATMTDLLRSKLSGMVRQAADIIKQWASERIVSVPGPQKYPYQEWISGPALDGMVSKTSWSHTFTVMAVPVELPWEEDDEEDNEVDLPTLPAVGVKPASRITLRALGMDWPSPESEDYLTTVHSRSVSEAVCFRGQEAIVPV